jgi:hypothetical protein
LETKSDAATAAGCPTKTKVSGSATPWRQQQLACPTRNKLSCCCQHNSQQQRTAALDAAPAGAVSPSLLGVYTKHQYTGSTAGPAAAAVASTARCPGQQHRWASCRHCLCLSGCRTRAAPTAGGTFFRNSSCRHSSRVRCGTCRPAAAGASV